MDRAQELSRHIRVAKQQPPIVMAALLNHLFSAQASHPCLSQQEGLAAAWNVATGICHHQQLFLGIVAASKSPACLVAGPSAA